MKLRIPNELLNMKLKPNELKVFVCLMRCQSEKGVAIVRAKCIAEICHISTVTVYTAIEGLCNVGLIRRSHRYNYDGQYIANRYELVQLPGGWFELGMQQEPLAMSATTFMVYLYLLRCKGKSGKAFPTLRKMQEVLGICRNTVIQAIKNLMGLKLLVRAALRAGKHNLYLLAFRIQEKKRSTAGKLCFSKKNKAGCERLLCNFILSRSRFVVNKTREQIVSLCQRVVHFFNNSSLTHPVYSKEKNL